MSHEENTVTTTSVSEKDFSLEVSDDRMTVVADCAAHVKQPRNIINKLSVGLQKLGLAEAFTDKELTAFVEQAIADEADLSQLVVIQGKPRIQPVDGKLEWTADFFATGFEIDEETGVINFREKLDNRSVVGEQLLARVYPAKIGTAGQDVYGNPLPVSAPERVRLRAGKGVEQIDKDGVEEFFARGDGRIRCVNNVVTVDNVYQIDGNVNLETGNIRHKGAVVITGDIEQGTIIEADGDVEVKGMAEPCTIVSGGSLIIVGGLVGSEENSLTLAGDLQARYVTEVIATVGGNLTVPGEINHSIIKCRGHVKVHGRIAGGQTTALQGMVLGQSGAEAGTVTELIVGVDHALEAELQPFKDRIEKLEEAKEKLDEVLADAIRRKSQLNDQQKQQALVVKQKSQDVGKALAAEKEKAQQVIEASRTLASERMEISNNMFSGTIFQLGNFRKKISASVLKPRQVLRKKSKVYVLPFGEDEELDEELQKELDQD